MFSLSENRLLAHVGFAGGLVIPAGSPGFVKYLPLHKPTATWTVRARRDLTPVALAEPIARLEVPLTQAEAAKARTLTVRLHSETARALIVSVNGKRSPWDKVPVTTGWQTVTLALDDLPLAAGENRLELDFGKGPEVAVEWLQLGGDAPPAATPRIHDRADDALLLPEGGTLTWYVKVPADGRLRASVAGDGCEVAVTATAQEGQASGTLQGVRAAVDLAPLAGKVARLELAGRGCPLARVTEAGLVVPGEEPEIVRGKPPRYVIFWVMDTLRADRVRGFAKEARAESPVFDRLAAEGTFFLHTYSGGAESQTSYASFWTGLYPRVHRIVTSGAPGWAPRLDPEFPTLGTLLADAGFANVGVTANGFVNEFMGHARGFVSFKNLMREGGVMRRGYVPGDAIVKLALENVEKRTDAPFLLYLGTVDTHMPYVGHKPWLDLYDPGPYKGKFVHKVLSGAIGVVKPRMVSTDPPPERDLQRILAIYDSNVSFQDALVGDVLEKFEEWGIRDQTMIVITGDHGEELWEHGVGGHGASAREAVARVPLIIHYPPLFPAAAVDEEAEGVDILPTILDALGIPAPASVQGASLLPLAHGRGRGYPRPAFVSQWEITWGMRLGGWKMRINKGGAVSLHELADDPHEHKDLADERVVERRWLTDAFSFHRVYDESWRKAQHGVTSNMTEQAVRDLEGRP